MNDVILHYDRLIDAGNDPFRDPPALREYMDRWDGEAFFDLLSLQKHETVLEIGVGTGRLAAKAAAQCRELWGIDLSPLTIRRAEENLALWRNVRLICGDFMSFDFSRIFDAVYSSLTFLHFADKQAALDRTASLLKPGGRFVLSIDKNQSPYIDMGEYRLTIHPDNPETLLRCARIAGLRPEAQAETEFAHLLLFLRD